MNHLEALTKNIGKEIVLLLSTENIKGELLSIDNNTIVLKSGENTLFVALNKINGFMIKDVDVQESVNQRIKTIKIDYDLNMLACCSNTCEGVKMFINGNVQPDDLELIMEDCPMRNKSCQCRLIGKFNQLKKEAIEELFDKLVIGEYPQRGRGRPRNG